MQRIVHGLYPTMTIDSVAFLIGFSVHLQFSDGAERDVDLEPYLHGPVFQPLRDDPHQFQAVQVDAELGTIVWPNGADIDPDVLHYGRKPAWMQTASTTQS